MTRSTKKLQAIWYKCGCRCAVCCMGIYVALGCLSFLTRVLFRNNYFIVHYTPAVGATWFFSRVPPPPVLVFSCSTLAQHATYICNIHLSHEFARIGGARCRCRSDSPQSATLLRDARRGRARAALRPRVAAEGSGGGCPKCEHLVPTQWRSLYESLYFLLSTPTPTLTL